MIDKVVVGRRISALRKELGYSQTIFAEKLNVSTQAVSKWETGLALPDVEVLVNISWICKASINTILEGEDCLSENSGIDRGLSYVGKRLRCPQCHGSLTMPIQTKQDKLCFKCEQGHRYDVVDGVVYFGTREIQGELWSLTFRNYEHYLLEQHHPGNPRYAMVTIHSHEVMWQNIKKLRPRTILDMACGTGKGIKYMIERIDWPVTIIMADVSHRILKWNRIFYSTEWKNPYVDMVYLACDCAHLPLEDNCMDVVFSNGGFESMQQKMMDGLAEGLRVLKPGANAVYNMHVVDDHSSENTQKWIRLYTSLDSTYHVDLDKMNDISQWVKKCNNTGFMENETIPIYGELPAPQGDVFPFENEVLQWMGAYVVISKK